MSNSTLVQIADILPPTAPVSASLDLGFYVFVFVVTAVTAVLWYIRSTKQKLRRLRKRYRQGRIDNRQCAFQLAGLLPQQENTTIVSSHEKNQSWQEYKNALQLACYSRQGVDGNAMSKLLRETEQWL